MTIIESDKARMILIDRPEMNASLEVYIMTNNEIGLILKHKQDRAFATLTRQELEAVRNAIDWALA